MTADINQRLAEIKERWPVTDADEREATQDVRYLLAETERLQGDEQFKMFFDWLEEECAIMPKVFANATEAVGFFNAYLRSRQERGKDE